MYQSNQASDQKENPSLLPAVGKAPRPAFQRPTNPSRRRSTAVNSTHGHCSFVGTVAQQPLSSSPIPRSNNNHNTFLYIWTCDADYKQITRCMLANQVKCHSIRSIYIWISYTSKRNLQSVIHKLRKESISTLHELKKLPIFFQFFPL